MLNLSGIMRPAKIQIAVLVFALRTLGHGAYGQPLLNSNAWHATVPFFVQPQLPQTVQISGYGACELVMYNLTLDYTQENSETFPSYGAVCADFAQREPKTDVLGPTLLVDGGYLLKEQTTDIGGLLEYAEMLGGLVIFHEWRYKGWSLPQSFMETGDVSGFKMDFILEDAMSFVKAVQKDYGYEGSPVILDANVGVEAFLARERYPDFFVGAKISSARVYGYPSQVPVPILNAASVKDTEIAQRANPECPNNIRNAYRLMEQLGNSTEGRAKLNEVFNLCEQVQVTDFASVWLDGSLRTYTANVIATVMVENQKAVADPTYGFPPFLLTAACDAYLAEPLEGDELIQAFANFIYFPRQFDPRGVNITNSCNDINILAGPIDYYPSDVLMFSWAICSGIMYNDAYLSSQPNGVTDMYYEYPFPVTDDLCNENHPNLTTDPEWAFRTFGPNMTAYIANLTNIVFVYGDNDENVVFGPSTNLSESVVTIIFPGGATVPDYDYCGNVPELKAAKERVVSIMKGWVNEATSGQLSTTASQLSEIPSSSGRKMQQLVSAMITSVAGDCPLNAGYCSSCGTMSTGLPCLDNEWCCICISIW